MRNLRFWYSVTGVVPLRGKGPSMSADNGHPENGGVETSESGAIATSSERLVDLYKEMVLIRAFEEACQRGFRQGKIGGYLHVYIGQEAVATGFLQAFEEGDRVITAYRDHAHALLLGSDPKEIMAELYGRGSGLVKGKGGSMHLFDVERGLMGGYGIVGGHIPLGVGFAYAQRYQETDSITQLYLEAVIEAAERVVEQIRETGKPYAVEALTYRTAPHGAADFFEKYRTKEEVQEWRQRDPIGMLEHKLIENDVIEEEKLEEIKGEVKERVQEAVTFADESEEPPIEELYTDVYAGADEYLGEE